MLVLQQLLEKSRIRETKHLLTDAESSTDAIGGWTKANSATKKTIFLLGDFRPLPNRNVQMLDHFFPLLFPKDSESLKILDIQLWEMGAKRPLKGTSKVKNEREKNFFLRGNFRQFSNKNVPIWDHFFPFLFPKDSESLKILDIRLRKVGAKRQLKKTKNRRRPKKVKKKTFLLLGDFRQFSNKNVHIWDHFFPLLFPKDSEPLKILDIPLWEVGGKRQLKKTENRRRPKKVKKKTFFCAAILDNF